MRNEYSISEIGKALNRHRENRLVVFNDQNSFTTICTPEWYQLLLFFCNQPLVSFRQVYFHRRTDAHFAIYLDMPSRLFGKPVNLRQTEPRASPDILCSEERLEHMRQYRGIDANTVIAHGNQYVCARPGVWILVCVGLVEQDIPGFYDNPTTIR